MENKNEQQTNEIVEGSEKLKLSVTRIKKLRMNVKTGDIGTAQYSYRPW